MTLAVAAALGRELGILRLRLPQAARQVPERIRFSAPAEGAFQFGFEMGTGVRTYMTAVAPYILVLGLLMWGTVGDALVAGASFGLGRAVMTVLYLRAAEPEGENTWFSAVLRHHVLLRMLCLAVTAWMVALGGSLA